MNVMTYKGYEALVQYDEDAEIFHGEVMNLRDVITFQGSSAEELKQAFANSVEDYLAFCQERGEEAGEALFRAVRRPGRSASPVSGSSISFRLLFKKNAAYAIIPLR